MATGNTRLIIALLVALAFMAQSLQAGAAWCAMAGPAPDAPTVETSSPCHGGGDKDVSPEPVAAAGASMDCCATDNCAMNGCMTAPPAFAALEPVFTLTFSHVYHTAYRQAPLRALPSSLFRPPNLR